MIIVLPTVALPGYAGVNLALMINKKELDLKLQFFLL